jgi:hypothetical protein
VFIVGLGEQFDVVDARIGIEYLREAVEFSSRYSDEWDDVGCVVGNHALDFADEFRATFERFPKRELLGKNGELRD